MNVKCLEPHKICDLRATMQNQKVISQCRHNYLIIIYLALLLQLLWGAVTSGLPLYLRNKRITLTRLEKTRSQRVEEEWTMTNITKSLLQTIIFPLVPSENSGRNVVSFLSVYTQHDFAKISLDHITV